MISPTDSQLLQSIFRSVEETRTDVAVLKSDVSALKSSVEGLKTDVAVLKSDVAVLKKDVAGLKSDMITVKSDMKSIKNTLRRHGSELRFLRETLNSVIGKTEAMTNFHSVRLDRVELHLALPRLAGPTRF